jgi:hypothetical protein
MSKLWDDLKENMKEWSSSAVEKAEEMSRIAMAKTEEMTRISKIKFEIHQLQRDKDRKFEELGKLAYSHTNEDHMATFSGNTDFFEIVNKVDNIKTEINDKESEIERIKHEYDIQDNEIETIHKENTAGPVVKTETDNDDKSIPVEDVNTENLKQE